MAAITDAEQTLLDQLLHQWKDSPNILALLGILADPLQDTIDVATYILDYEDLDDIEGELLDFFAGLIGVTRPPLQELNIFTMCELGESGDLDGTTGFYDDTDTVVTGGYFTSLKGCPNQDDPTQDMADVDFRKMIRMKASTFRSKMTHRNLFNYLLDFGSRCKVSSPSHHMVDMDPGDYYGPHALTDFFRYHIEQRGFRPAGMGVNFTQNIRKDEL